ncbi:MAG: hypothetical protein AB7F53_09060 [Nitrososphaeraceae archaeon]
MHIILWTTLIIVLSVTEITSLNSSFEHAFSQRDSEIPPLVEPDKNITIMSIENISSTQNI